MLKNKKISFLGAGNMAEALIKGILNAKLINPENIFAADIDEDRLTKFKKAYKINVIKCNGEAVSDADIIILSVKPQVMVDVLEDIKGRINKDKLIISIAAGITIDRLKKGLGADAHIIRVMPNTPALVQEGATAISCCDKVSDEELNVSEYIFNSIGISVKVAESLLDAVTGLSGSGPAYVSIIIEALADAGVKMGLPRDVSLNLSAQTVMGTGKLILNSSIQPSILKDLVSSPGGTTIHGLHKLEEGGIRGIIINAVEAATKRSIELGKN